MNKLNYTVEIDHMPLIGNKHGLVEEYLERIYLKNVTYDKAIEKFNSIKIKGDIRSVHLFYTNIDMTNTNFPYIAYKYSNKQVID